MTFEQRPGGDKKANHAHMQEEAARGSDPVRGCGTVEMLGWRCLLPLDGMLCRGEVGACGRHFHLGVEEVEAA